MSRRLKTLATLNVLGWLVAVPVLLAALLGPIVGFDTWPASLLPGGAGGTVQLADTPERSGSDTGSGERSRGPAEPGAPGLVPAAVGAAIGGIPAAGTGATAAGGSPLGDADLLRARAAARHVSASLSAAARSGLVPRNAPSSSPVVKAHGRANGHAAVKPGKGHGASKTRSHPVATAHGRANGHAAVEPVKGHGPSKTHGSRPVPKAHKTHGSHPGAKAHNTHGSHPVARAPKPVKTAPSSNAPTPPAAPVRPATPVRPPAPVRPPTPVKPPKPSKAVKVRPAPRAPKAPKIEAPAAGPIAPGHGNGHTAH